MSEQIFNQSITIEFIENHEGCGCCTEEFGEGWSERIVACVNHCKGATNEELEATSYEQIHERLKELETQRDELLASLELYMKRLNDGWLTNLAWREDTHTIMQKAINNAKGGQQ